MAIKLRQQGFRVVMLDILRIHRVLSIKRYKLMPTTHAALQKLLGLAVII